MQTTGDQPGNDQEIVSGYYDDYKQTQAEIFAVESKRVRNSIFWIAGLFFASDLLGLAIANLVSPETLLYALLFPVLFIGLGLLSTRQPMLSIALAMVLFAGIIILSIVVYGGVGAIKGILVKAIIVYFLLAGFQSAKTAEQAKKDMR